MTSKREHLLNAISFLNRYYDADSVAYKLKNPLLLKSFTPGKHPVNEDGVREFDSFQGGFRSGLFDLNVKLDGKSNCGLQPTDKLKNLLAVYGINKDEDLIVVVSFLKKSVDKSITLQTELRFF